MDRLHLFLLTCCIVLVVIIGVIVTPYKRGTLVQQQFTSFHPPQAQSCSLLAGKSSPLENYPIEDIPSENSQSHKFQSQDYRYKNSPKRNIPLENNIDVGKLAPQQHPHHQQPLPYRHRGHTSKQPTHTRQLPHHQHPPPLQQHTSHNQQSPHHHQHLAANNNGVYRSSCPSRHSQAPSILNNPRLNKVLSLFLFTFRFILFFFVAFSAFLFY